MASNGEGGEEVTEKNVYRTKVDERFWTAINFFSNRKTPSRCRLEFDAQAENLYANGTKQTGATLLEKTYRSRTAECAE